MLLKVGDEVAVLQLRVLAALHPSARRVYLRPQRKRHLQTDDFRDSLAQKPGDRLVRGAERAHAGERGGADAGLAVEEHEGAGREVAQEGVDGFDGRGDVDGGRGEVAAEEEDDGEAGCCLRGRDAQEWFTCWSHFGAEHAAC